MNPPFDHVSKIYNTYSKRDRLFNEVEAPFSKSTQFNFEDSDINSQLHLYDSDLKRTSRSKSFDIKNSNNKDILSFTHTDHSYSYQNVSQKTPCQCANKVLTLLNYLLTYCGTLQIERDKALESLKVEKESKTKLTSQLEESIQREKQLLIEVNRMREIIKNSSLPQ